MQERARRVMSELRVVESELQTTDRVEEVLISVMGAIKHEQVAGVDYPL